MKDSKKASTVDNKLTSLSKKIVEIKKKIQLSEGQRKANFEECDTIKRQNIDRLARLNKEVKELYAEFVKANNNEEAAERAIQSTQQLSAHLKTLGINEIITKINEETVGLRNKYDLMRYEKNKLRQNLAYLINEYEELKSGKLAKLSKKKMEIPLKNKITDLEVRLERVRSMQIKVDIARRKFKSVYADLKEKSVSYTSSLKELEDDIAEQEEEIRRLRGVKEEAVGLRDITQVTLEKEEMEETMGSKERDREIRDYRRRVTEKKMALERLERTIFLTRPQDNSSRRSKEVAEEEKEKDKEDMGMGKDEGSQLEETFAKLRGATGVSRSEELLNRFLGQRATKRSLQNMRKATEDEKIILEQQRQQLTDQIENHKFSETSDANRNAEDVELIVRQIEDERTRQKKAETEEQQIQQLIHQILHTLLRICQKIPGISKDEIFEDDDNMNDPSKLTHLLTEQIRGALEAPEDFSDVLQDLDDITINKFDAMSIVTTSPESRVDRRENMSLFSRFPSTGSPAQPSEDEEEVPTRNILKRQAQVLFDAKSRRKGFNLKR